MTNTQRDILENRKQVFDDILIMINKIILDDAINNQVSTVGYVKQQLELNKETIVKG